jgi:hypothetical protein
MNLDDIATKQDLQILSQQVRHLTDLVEKMAGTTASEVLSISQIQRMGVLGGYDRIKRLIRSGSIQSTPDGKITRSALDKYLGYTTRSSSEASVKSPKNLTISNETITCPSCDAIFIPEPEETTCFNCGESFSNGSSQVPICFTTPGIKSLLQDQEKSLTDKIRFQYLSRMEYGPCGGTKHQDFWIWEQLEREGFVRLDKNQPKGLYQSRLSTKGKALLKAMIQTYGINGPK